MSNVRVLYEDNHIIAAVKPAGVLAQGDRTRDESVLGMVKKYLKEKYKKPGNVFVGLLHRLDRPGSGIMLFAKTNKGASRLSEQFRNRTIEKTYHALVCGKPKVRKGVLVNHLIKDEKLKKGRQKAGGDEAVLHYEVIRFNKKYSLLKIQIDGGQFHQIRTQLSLAGLPIVGDVKYKGEAWADQGAIALCATMLSFKKATEDGIVSLMVDLPKEWENYF